MNYIIVDFEWNQPLPEQPMVTEPFAFDSEIIEIGAIRLNDRFETEEDYKAYVKPVCYPVMNGKVVRLTKIRPQELCRVPNGKRSRSKLHEKIQRVHRHIGHQESPPR